MRQRELSVAPVWVVAVMGAGWVVAVMVAGLGAAVTGADGITIQAALIGTPWSTPDYERPGRFLLTL